MLRLRYCYYVIKSTITLFRLRNFNLLRLATFICMVLPKRPNLKTFFFNLV